jgi:hypothetical protein
MVVAICGLLAGIMQGCGDQPRAAAATASSRTAVQYFAALTRPDVAPIAKSVRARIGSGLQQSNPDVNLGTLRLLRRKRVGADTIDVYAAAGSRSICGVTRHTRARGRGPGSSGCGPATEPNGTPLIHTSSSSDTGGMFLLTALVPNRVDALSLRFSDGSTQSLAVVNNTAIYRGSRRPSVLVYNDPAGSTQRDNVSPDGP